MKQKLSYSIKGKGIPIVFIHGYLENRNVWKIFLSQFKDYQHIYVDLPGCGDSPALEQPTIENMGNAVYILLKQLNVSSYFLVGHSMGGYVAIDIAEKHFKEVKGLVLLHSHPFADNNEKRENRMKEIAIVKNGKKDILIKSFVPKLHSPNYTDESVLKFYHQMALSTTAEGMIACLQAMAMRPDKSIWLQQTSIPVLWMYGKNDTLFNFELAENFKVKASTTKVLLQNSAHIGMYEETEKVVSLLELFFSKYK